MASLAGLSGLGRLQVDVGGGRPAPDDGHCFPRADDGPHRLIQTLRIFALLIDISSCVGLDKKNGKLGPEGQMWIHLFCP
eukprot:5854655-Pyramimonas_sp.AAC.1